MARLTAAMLCDFAQVRENLLFVSSAGISRLYHPSAPVRPNLFVAGIVEVGPAEFDRTHELRVRVRSPGPTVGLGCGLRARSCGWRSSAG